MALAIPSDNAVAVPVASAQAVPLPVVVTCAHSVQVARGAPRRQRVTRKNMQSYTGRLPDPLSLMQCSLHVDRLGFHTPLGGTLKSTDDCEHLKLLTPLGRTWPSATRRAAVVRGAVPQQPRKALF